MGRGNPLLHLLLNVGRNRTCSSMCSFNKGEQHLACISQVFCKLPQVSEGLESLTVVSRKSGLHWRDPSLHRCYEAHPGVWLTYPSRLL